MINFLKGKVIEKSSDQLTLLVQDVGYQVLVSTKTLKELKLKTTASVYIYTHVREDTISLFGFLNSKQKQVFELLLSVSGVGPKIALAINNAGSVNQITSAIQSADVNFFTSISGLGKKSAQRIIIDLKSKLGSQQELDLKDAKTYPDVQAALKTLGISKKESLEAIAKVKNKDKLTDQDIIKQSLKQLK